MPNYFTENSDLRFHFEHLALESIVALAEENYEPAKIHDCAPTDYQDATRTFHELKGRKATLVAFWFPT